MQSLTTLEDSDLESGFIFANSSPKFLKVVCRVLVPQLGCNIVILAFVRERIWFGCFLTPYAYACRNG